jgi:signal transduction histidine kinase
MSDTDFNPDVIEKGELTDDDKQVEKLRDKAEREPSESIDDIVSLLNYAEDNGKLYLEAGCCQSLAVAYYNTSDFKKSLKSANRALDIYVRLNNAKGIAAALNNKGRVFIALGDYKDALQNHFEALKILEGMDDKKQSAHIYNNIGLIYWYCDNYEKALENYNKSLLIKKEFGDKRGIAKTLNNIGNVYKVQEELTKALKFYSQALDIGTEIGNSRGVSVSLNNIGTIYKDLEQYEKARSYFDESLEIKNRIGDKQGIANTYLNLGFLSTKLGNNEEALKYYEDGLKICDIEEMKPLQMNFYFDLSEFYRKLNDYETAYKYLNMYLCSKQRILNETVLKQFTDLQLRYEVEKMEKENELLRQKNELQKLEIATQNHLKELNATKDKLFSIIEHDLKSPFTVMTSFLNIMKRTDTYEKDKVHALVYDMEHTVNASLALLENLLEWARSQKGAIQYEPRHLKLSTVVDNIFKLFNANSQSKQVLLKNLALYSVYADKNMLNTILRNLISNAIKFSYSKGEIIVYSEDKGNEILISVIDNGTGMEQETANSLFMIDAKFKTLGTHGEKGTGIGLLLCKEFIEKCKGRIWIETEPGRGSKFHFTLPKGTD